MSATASVFVLAAAVFAVSMGAGFAPRILTSRLTDTQLADLTGIASGLLLAGAVLVVIPEGFDVAAHDGEFVYEPLLLGAAILVGFALMLVLEGFGVGHAVHEEHHDHAEGHGHGHVHHPTSPLALGIGLSIHAIADGLAIGSAVASGDEAFGVLIGVAVLLHRAPAAFSLGLFTLHETRDPAVLVKSITGFALATPVALVVSYWLLDGASDGTIALAMLFSAGTFVYVATVDTLPAVHNTDIGRRSVRNVLIGAALFAAVLWGADLAGLLEHSHA